MRPVGVFLLAGAVSAGVLVRIILVVRRQHPSESCQPVGGGVDRPSTTAGGAGIGEESLLCSFHYRMQR